MEIGLVLEGSMSVRCSGKHNIMLDKGEVYFCNRNVMHSMRQEKRRLAGGMDWIYYYYNRCNCCDYRNIRFQRCKV
ncbi:hypothetical protein FYJ25_02840 [Anaerobutyricum soehngenii]|uniref:Uncharacterized protein n=1 Tax=Anaerobutyricum soehngenii TaxID=105843 RepID=A0A6N7Y0C5_9FIRM|nr:hypothetical protein [Anaerobutyricum soehngenii]